MGHNEKLFRRSGGRIDRAMQKLHIEAYESAYDLLKRESDILLEVSDALLDKETISGKEFEAIFNGESLEKDDWQQRREHLEKDDLSEEVVEELKKKEDN